MRRKRRILLKKISKLWWLCRWKACYMWF